MKPLKAHFIALALTSSLVGAGSAMAQTPPVSKAPNAADQCVKLESEESRKACMTLGLVVNAHKEGNSQEVTRLFDKMHTDQIETRKAERSEALNMFRSPSP